ncbi:hypothetical protein [Luteolibacter luteus]|uniref:DUF4175 domain-containing protein n=1 Tax=Luteolibacter luteus TaxID=2728835 RepID=A0A858RNA3_9BACT|nr:hypothetical protein [Luteolibacter luteus]QJE97984.1 DUF4175 domain-containing protein [Luteolibacter luteus]
MKAVAIALVGLVSVVSGEIFNLALPKNGPPNYPANAPTKHAAPPIDIPSGTTLQVLGVSGHPLAGAAIQVSGLVVESDLTSAAQKPAGFSTASTVAGPATVTFFRLTSDSSIVSYSITSPDESSKSNTAIIPDDDSGDHDVILEASSDLQTWVPIQPGSYAATTTRRFFRVRVQKQ